VTDSQNRCSVPAKLTIALCILTLPLCAADVQATGYGAKGDAQTINTQAIQRAIDAAAKTSSTVVFKPGVYLTGALFLKSGMHFRVDEGVTIRGVQDLSAYPEMPTRIAGIEMTWPAALINVYEQSNVELLGKGIIDGDGKYWWDKYWALRKEYDAKGLRWAADYDCKRVRLIQVYKSQNVAIRDLNLQRSGFWTVHLCYSSNINVDGVVIRNNIGGRGPSTDGIDLDSSSDVSIAHADIECNDDAICMKAGRDADGIRVNRPTTNVTVRDCTVRVGAGGFTIGSETSGGIHNVTVSGLTVFSGAPRGIIIKSAKTRGGTVDQIRISNVTLDGVATPVDVGLNWNPSYSYAHIPDGIANVPDYWRVLATPVPPDKGLPHVRGVQISNLKATGAKQAFSVNAYSNDPIENFTLDNIDIQAQTAGTIANARDWTFSNVILRTADGTRPTFTDCAGMKWLAPQ